MPTADASSRARLAARRKQGATILAALVMGASVDQIAEQHALPQKRVEKLLREELRRRWLAPAQDYARLQIARLEEIYAQLIEGAKKGDGKAIDRILRLLDRLDRYYGFGKLTATATAPPVDYRQKLIDKFDQMSRRLPPPQENS